MRYLVVGHVCKDLVPNGWSFGGTATFAALTARATGWQPHVITSTGPDLDPRVVLDDIEVVNSPAEHSTSFENTYTPHGRVQTLRAVANRLDPRLLRAVMLDRRPIDVVHLAPVAQEVDYGWLDRVRGTFIGLTPQGWLRQWAADGHVQRAAWPEAEFVLKRATATVISIEDIDGDEALARQWSAWARLLVVTRGRDGCSIYYDGVITDLPAMKVDEVDPTGAGDVFAAAFFIRLKQTGSPIAAARFANCMGAKFVTRRGFEGIPTATEIQQCLQTSPLFDTHASTGARPAASH